MKRALLHAVACVALAADMAQAAPGTAKPASATAVGASCDWNNPGHNRYTGSAAAALQRQQRAGLITADEARQIAQAMARRQHDVATITATTITSARHLYSPVLHGMHFGAASMCTTAADRSRWPATLSMQALVYCADTGACAVGPAACTNWAVTRRLSGAAGGQPGARTLAAAGDAGGPGLPSLAPLLGASTPAGEPTAAGAGTGGDTPSTAVGPGLQPSAARSTGGLAATTTTAATTAPSWLQLATVPPAAGAAADTAPSPPGPDNAPDATEPSTGSTSAPPTGPAPNPQPDTSTTSPGPPPVWPGLWPAPPGLPAVVLPAPVAPVPDAPIWALLAGGLALVFMAQRRQP